MTQRSSLVPDIVVMVALIPIVVHVVSCFVAHKWGLLIIGTLIFPVGFFNGLLIILGVR